MLQALQKATLRNIFFTILAAIPAIMPIILAGRRQPTMTVCVIVGLTVWFAKRFVPPKIFFLLLIVIGIFIIPLFGQLRGETWNLAAQRDWETLMSSSEASLESVMEGEILELRNAAMIMDASASAGRYGYGTGYWDSLVFQFVPGQIVGNDLKRSLQFRWGPDRSYLASLHNYYIHSGTTDTGIGDSFREFDYFGCLFFALMGILFRILWISANYHRSKFSMLLYIGLISPAMVAVTHGTGRFLQEAIFQLFFVSAAIYFARRKASTHLALQNTTKVLN